jgi:hypothetical protein
MKSLGFILDRKISKLYKALKDANIDAVQI